MNTDPRMPVSLSLGQSPLVSTPPWGPAGPSGHGAVAETITFKVPSCRFEQFDELRVVFHRSRFGWDGARASLSIDSSSRGVNLAPYIEKGHLCARSPRSSFS